MTKTSQSSTERDHRELHSPYLKTADEPTMRLLPIYNALSTRTKRAVRQDDLVRFICRCMVGDVFTSEPSDFADPIPSMVGTEDCQLYTRCEDVMLE